MVISNLKCKLGISRNGHGSDMAWVRPYPIPSSKFGFKFGYILEIL